MNYTIRFSRKQRNFMKRLEDFENIIICEKDIRIIETKNKNGNKLVVAKWANYNNFWVIGMSICHENDEYDIVNSAHKVYLETLGRYH